LKSACAPSGKGMQRTGYNLFALEPMGTGKRAFVRQFFEQRAKAEATPSDWRYANNFDESHRPPVMRLPPGKGVTFRGDMEH
jgi:hypothetical protein